MTVFQTHPNELYVQSISMSQSICPSARLNAAENDEIQCREMRSYLTRVFCSPITFNYLNVGRLVLPLLLLLQGITDSQQKRMIECYECQGSQCRGCAHTIYPIIMQTEGLGGAKGNNYIITISQDVALTVADDTTGS